MFGYFYGYSNLKMPGDLYNGFDEEGFPPSPPGLSALVNNAGDFLINSEHTRLVGTD